MQLQFGTLDNNLVLGSIVLIAAWTTCILLRLTYLLSDDTSFVNLLPARVRSLLPKGTLFPSSFLLPAHLCLVLYGHRLARALSVAYLALCLLLSARVNVSVSAGGVWQLEEVVRGYWACVRICLAALLALLLSILHTHCGLRLLACALLPVACVLELLSEVANAMQLSCPTAVFVSVSGGSSDESTLSCVPALLPSTSALSFYAWRDVVSAVVSLLLLSATYWLTGLYGWFSDSVVIPSHEHQLWAAEVHRARRQRQRYAKAKKKRDPLLSRVFG